PYDLTDEQKVFLKDDMVRCMLMASIDSTSSAVRWNNTVQQYVEGEGHGIPVAIFSDPRNGAASDMIFEAGGEGTISRWPSFVGIGATADPSVAYEFGRCTSLEYRALGVTTALSPQADVCGEPRWWRISGTFGESYEMAADMVRGYIDGMQTSPSDCSIDGSWGLQSVNAMVKHWVGCDQEGGREGHFAHGEYSVYPAGRYRDLEKPFVEGAFKLEQGTGCVAGVMTNYSVPWGQDPSGENVACSFSEYVVGERLRKANGFDGLVCTDWDVCFDCTEMGAWGKGKPWGVEHLSVSERHLKVLEAGCDMFGGENFSQPIVDAYRLWSDKYGEESARERFEQSATRILVTMFQTGIFENPYLDMESTLSVVGAPEFMEAGYNAQLKSVVMLKNVSGVLPAEEKSKVYVPKRHYPAIPGVWGGITTEKYDYPVALSLVEQYYEVVETPQDADFALVFIEQPSLNIGYSKADVAAGGNGYVPVPLQYDDYTAEYARESSIAGGNPLESFVNRSYKGKTSRSYNRDDMVLVRTTKEEMGDKPVVLVVNLDKPLIPAEIEPYADAILLSFDIQRQALMDVISGRFEPSGKLPFQLPADMRTVEEQQEDVLHDMRCYKDAEGNVYDFGFGMNWSGVINSSYAISK
ncbi:MAG: glycoside hydrolase family 3 C-terminal domain-containing protein, partial [Bacteroidales bacterium]|nr:glycoside hydrolase family 3 C-terminal domain-containing protein [Bacteroidales bacterium]